MAKSKGEAAVRELVEKMDPADRDIARRLDEVIRAAAPHLQPKLWYGQPAYAAGGKVVVFFRGAVVDGERYLTLGFTGRAQLDDGFLWPTSYAVTGLDAKTERRIADLVTAAAPIET